MKQSLIDKTLLELTEILRTLGEPKFRPEQIFYELQNGKTLSEMTNISPSLATTLLENFTDAFPTIKTVKKSLDGTRKFLFALEDGNLVESVLMTYKFGNTLCISTQVGCRMRCKFCASGLDGLVRNLTAGEMIAQIILANKALSGSVKERKITNIVLMGSGEPLDNFLNVTKFFHLATDKHGLNFSERNLSLSTCGIPEKIRALAESGRQINLCLSLHAPNDALRRQIMPIAKVHKISEVLSACDFYAAKTNRRILLEYILIKNLNSKREHALELAKKLCGKNVLVNLITLSEVKEIPLKAASEATTSAFAAVLKSYKIPVTIRRSLGSDIDGACGQLRRHHLNPNK